MRAKLSQVPASDATTNRRNIIVDVLAVFFGIGTWIGINSTFIQLPLLVAETPEGWSLPSYLSLMVQIGNLGPISYTIIQKFSKNKKKDANLIYGLLALGTCSVLLTAFLYNKTAVIFGDSHSVALFIFTILTALNACTSSVLFMPYMGRFKEVYMVTYFIGEGLSGLLPSVLALIQGIGGAEECVLTNVTETGVEVYEKHTSPPRFSTAVFFMIIFALMVCSCVGFTLLDRLKLSKKEYAVVQISAGNDYVYEQHPTDVHSSEESLNKQLSSAQYYYLLALIGVVCFFSNGVFNSIQSYSCLPYGSQTYHLSATLSVIANPVACFLAIFLQHTSLRLILTLSCIATALVAYVLLTAFMSPLPPLHDSNVGAVIVIIVWTVLIGLISYIKLAITVVMRSQGGKSLVWTGGLSQLGSMIGALLSFGLVNFTDIFQQADSNGC